MIIKFSNISGNFIIEKIDVSINDVSGKLIHNSILECINNKTIFDTTNLDNGDYVISIGIPGTLEKMPYKQKFSINKN